MRLTRTLESLTTDAARAMAEAALSAARTRGFSMVVAVTDQPGDLLCLVRDSTAFPASVGIASDKARTAAQFGMSTDDLRGAVSANTALQDGIGLRPGVVLFGGGFPIVKDGQVIGGIGASGGSEDDDRLCAQAGLNAFAAVSGEETA